MKMRRIIIVCVIGLTVISILVISGYLLLPKYIDEGIEGNLIGEYYVERDTENIHQVIFLGDCEVYSSFSPPYLWQEYGITSYVRGSPQQLISQSYYLLEEMLKYERPSVVVFNVFSMKYDGGQNEAYNRMTLDGMRLSLQKLMSAVASATDGESILSYVFPTLRFHSRWDSLTIDDVKYMFERPQLSHNGFLMQTKIVPRGEHISFEGQYADEGLPESSFFYLDKMLWLCRDNGIELVLVKSPTNTWKYWWYENWDNEIKEYATENGIGYYNLSKNTDIEIDYSHDTYDGGAHLNVYGAEKVTKFFGEILKNNYGVSDMRNNGEISRIWDKKLDIYNDEKKMAEISN